MPIRFFLLKNSTFRSKPCIRQVTGNLSDVFTPKKLDITFRNMTDVNTAKEQKKAKDFMLQCLYDTEKGLLVLKGKELGPNKNQ